MKTSQITVTKVTELEKKFEIECSDGKKRWPAKWDWPEGFEVGKTYTIFWDVVQKGDKKYYNMKNALSADTGRAVAPQNSSGGAGTEILSRLDRLEAMLNEVLTLLRVNDAFPRE